MASTFTHVRTADIGTPDHPYPVEVYRNDRTGLLHVVERYGRERDQVVSVMPWDMPDQSDTRWVGNANDAGIAYVSSGRSRGHVNRSLAALRRSNADRF